MRWTTRYLRAKFSRAIATIIMLKAYGLPKKELEYYLTELLGLFLFLKQNKPVQCHVTKTCLPAGACPPLSSVVSASAILTDYTSTFGNQVNNWACERSL